MSAQRAKEAVRRRAARKLAGANTRHSVAIAETFRARVLVADQRRQSEEMPSAVIDHPVSAALGQHYLVLYFALAVISVLAAAVAHRGGLRANPWLIAMTPQTISRTVTEPPSTSLREMPFQDVSVLTAPGPPALTGLATLRETILSRQVDILPEPGPVSGTGTNTAPGKTGQDAGAPAAVIDDEFGSGLRAPGICELPEGLENDQVRDALPVQNAASLASTPPTQVTQTEFGTALAAAAQRQTAEFTVYTDKYRRMSYPMGDVPALFGVCTDVIIRAYRALGIDLQALIHVARIGPADTSIAHRRTFTLRRYFASRGASVPISEFAEDYQPGDIVTYHRPQNRGSRDHIAIVSNLIAPSGRPMIVHNRGWGPQIEDALFVDKITGHYRYRGLERQDALDVNAEANPGLAGPSIAKPKRLPQKPRAAEAKSQPKLRSGKSEAPTVRR